MKARHDHEDQELIERELRELFGRTAEEPSAFQLTRMEAAARDVPGSARRALWSFPRLAVLGGSLAAVAAVAVILSPGVFDGPTGTRFPVAVTPVAPGDGSSGGLAESAGALEAAVDTRVVYATYFDIGLYGVLDEGAMPLDEMGLEVLDAQEAEDPLPPGGGPRPDPR